jgi:S1-C subfamily serine protease
LDFEDQVEAEGKASKSKAKSKGPEPLWAPDVTDITHTPQTPESLKAAEKLADDPLPDPPGNTPPAPAPDPPGDPAPQEETGFLKAIMPKTLVGLAMWLVIFAAGAAVSSVVLFAFYQFRVSHLQTNIDSFKEDFQKDFDRKLAEFNDLVKSSKADIEKAAGGSEQAAEVQKLLEKVGPSVAYVQGAASSGDPTFGTGFVVLSDSHQSGIVTSFKNVEGSISAKTAVRVKIGSADVRGSVYIWDVNHDLALVTINTPNLPLLDWAKEDPAVGSRAWTIAASPGRYKAEAARGLVLDVSDDALLTDAAVPSQAAGGPLLNKDGKVIGVLSLHYAPDGYLPAAGWAVPVRFTCRRVLKCPS